VGRLRDLTGSFTAKYLLRRRRPRLGRGAGPRRATRSRCAIESHVM
jgi:hypothetical protein